MKCLICGQQDGHTKYTFREMMNGSRDGFEYFECGKCGCLQISDIPHDLERYYGSDYYSFSPDRIRLRKPRFSNNLRIRRDRAAVLGRDTLGLIMCRLPQPYGCSPRLKLFRPVNLDLNSRILDVGCGCGDMLLTLEPIGFCNLTGIDPYMEEDSILGGGIRLLKTTMADLKEKFDLVMLNHSLEHMPDPHKAFKEISSLLDPGASCLIRIPTVSSYVWQHYRENWVQIDAPRHLFLFSIDSIRVLAAANGFSVEHIEYDSTVFQFLGSEQYLRDIPLLADNSYAIKRDASIFSQQDIERYQKISLRLNKRMEGDQCAIVLRKN